MSTSSQMSDAAMAKHVRVTGRALIVALRDGRTLSVPVEWYPRLAHGTPRERQRCEIIGPGVGIHWPALDEDVSIQGLLLGRPSGESEESFSRWLSARPRQSNRRLNRTPAVVKETRAEYKARPKRRRG